MLAKFKKTKSIFYLSIIFFSCFLIANTVDYYDYQIVGNDIVVYDKRFSKSYRLKNFNSYAPGVIIRLPLPEDFEEEHEEELEEKAAEKEKEEKLAKEKEENKKNLGDSSENKMVLLLLEKSKGSYIAGDLSNALEYLRQAKEIEPNSALINKMIGSVYMEQDNKELGLQFYQESLKNNPEQDDLKIEINKITKERTEKEWTS